ncbi:high-temperature-induced dauer-formation protein-domain-containing protein [Tuber indicum]|nr:high-temperature-induced dauer-formation protein-domain-containing protein [Tuber indicum]
MGAGDSKLSFKKGVFRLAEEYKIPPHDPYWLSFWELPESAEDVFTLFAAADIRRTRDQHLENLETLILAVTSRLFALKNHPSFPDPELAPEKHALNCIRILTRILPFLHEKDGLAAWEEKFFWGTRRMRSRKASLSRAEVIFDEAHPDEDPRPPTAAEDIELAPPLMEELIDTLIGLLFYSGFTLIENPSSKGKVTYAIWQSGVGCNTPVGTTKELESNKIEALRLLLAITSKAMFIPANILPVRGTRALTYIATSADKKAVLSTLCSLLNTTLRYNPASWRVPYDHVVFSDPRQILVTYCLQLLLVLLLYPVPESGPGEHPLKNNYRHYLGRLHRTQDFQFLVDGMTRVLNQPIQATASYLPGSQKTIQWAPEMLMLFWESLQCNKRFRSFIIETDRVHDFVILIIYYALEHRLDPSKSGVVRMCVFVLQTLSTEPKFGMSLNKHFEGQNTLPSSVRIPSFSGTYADYLIISIYSLIAGSKGRLGAVYPALLAIIANVAPHVKPLSAAASAKLVQLFASMSAPAFLLANETNHALLHSLLESMNSIIEHNYSENANFVYSILRAHKRFEALRNFTLESGQEEIDRQDKQKKDRGESQDASAKGSISRDDFASPVEERGSMAGSESPIPPSQFEIGDDEDSDEEDRSKSQPPTSSIETPVPTRSPTIPSRTPSISSSAEDAVPIQLRAMSEKARGKLPEGSFHRQTSTTSLASHASAPATVTSLNGFTPSQTWIESWLPHLPLHTILVLIQQLQPPLREILARNNGEPNATSMLECIRTTEIHGIEPSLIKTHMFEWSPLALGWYESLLWGFVFIAERHVSKGTVGVWNGTAVKLFRVQETTPEGPSLLAPRGGVDAIGTNLIERLGSVSLGRGQRQRNSSDNGTGGNRERHAVV